MDLCRVEFRLAVGKPHDDLCGLLPISLYPQVKIGNDLVEKLEEICLRRSPPRPEFFRKSGQVREAPWPGAIRRVFVALTRVL